MTIVHGPEPKALISINNADAQSFPWADRPAYCPAQVPSYPRPHSIPKCGQTIDQLLNRAQDGIECFTL